MPTLSIQLPGLPPVSHVLKDDTITIGRMKGNTIVIEDSSISLMHAKITRKNSEFLLKDLNSTNGTSVNGQPIGEVLLRDRDKVQFAEISCQFLTDAVEQVVSSGAVPAVPSPLPARQPPAVPAISVTAAPAAPIAKSPPGRRSRQPSFAFLRYAGAVLAVGVVSFVGWRIYQLNHASLDVAEHARNAVLPASARGLTEAKAQLVVPNQDKAPAESTSKLPKAAKAADNEPSIPEALAKRTAETRDEKNSSDEGVRQLVEALKSQEVAERQRAAAALHSLGAGAKDAIPALRIGR